tara:strand:+ start:1090 stop:1305 length:216 start_codon:yes stop_codon:yes gene_type:complete
MHKAIILPLAKLDISEAAAWYQSKQIGLGKRFIQEVRSTVLHIRKNPINTFDTLPPPAYVVFVIHFFHPQK